MTVEITATPLRPLGPVQSRRSGVPALPEPISFSRFASFVATEGAAKDPEVQMTRREQGRYTNALDYWALLRTQIVAHHEYPPGPAGGALQAAVELAPDERRWHYARAVAEYRRFLNGRSVTWLGRPRPALWLAEGLQVRVNPELHLSVDGGPMVIKLFLRSPASQSLDQQSAEALAHLLDSTHGHLGLPVVFDVFRGRVVGPPRHASASVARLSAEARAFVQIWSELDGRAPTALVDLGPLDAGLAEPSSADTAPIQAVRAQTPPDLADTMPIEAVAAAPPGRAKQPAGPSGMRSAGEGAVDTAAEVVVERVPVEIVPTHPLPVDPDEEEGAVRVA